MHRTSTLSAGPSIQDLTKSVKGQVIGPDDSEYDSARRVFLTGIDRRPAAIIQPAEAGDVSTVVSLARESGVELAVRSGGHSFAAHGVSEGGWVLDLSSMRGLEIDAAGQTVWAETGLTAGEYTAAVGAHDLATGFGDSPTVGIGGITLGGGVGLLHRKLGLTIDSLLAAEIVTADGRRVHTDADTEPDLFWAIRGGGGNFGVATRFRFRLHEVSAVVGGMLVLPATAERITAFVAEAEAAPEELSGIIGVLRAPPMPFIPAEHHGRPVIFALMVHIGDAEAGARAFAPFRSLATPLLDGIRPMRYPEIYDAGEAPHPAAAAIRSTFVDTIDHAAAERILERVQTSSAMMAAAQIRVLGGAVARVPEEATAFHHRHRRVLVNIAAMYADIQETPVHEAWVDAFASELAQGEPGAFASFLSDAGEAHVRDAYPSPTWARLQVIKQRYDPTNLFRLNQNIPPGGRSETIE